MAEAALYVVFVCGQALYVLKRMSFAVRAPENPIKRRREYLYRNWDVIVIRGLLELPIFLAWWNGQLGTYITNHTGWTIPAFLQAGPVSAFILGYFSDAMLDWGMTSKFMPDFFKRGIPPLNGRPVP
jgi:hypothetical protein